MEAHRAVIRSGEGSLWVCLRATALGAVLLGAACTTPYQKMGFKGGYKDTRLKEGHYFVEVSVNAYTDRSTAVKYLWRRAGEVCHEAGYADFKMDTEMHSTNTTLTVTDSSVTQTDKAGVSAHVFCTGKGQAPVAQPAPAQPAQPPAAAQPPAPAPEPAAANAPAAANRAAPRAPAPRAQPAPATSAGASKPDTGSLGGACYGNGTCNVGLECNLSRKTCVRIGAKGARGGACYPNGTCNQGLTCQSGTCQ